MQDDNLLVVQAGDDELGLRNEDDLARRGKLELVMKTLLNRIGVVILDCDQAHVTERCLSSIGAGTVLPRTIVIVANSNDPEPLRRACKRSGLSPVVRWPGRNLGCAGGRNLGMEYLCSETDTDSFVVLDNDTVVPADFFDSIGRLRIEPLEVVAPVIFDLVTHTVWSSGGSVAPNGSTHVFSCLPGVSPLSVDWAPGACLIMSRATWLSVGPFEPVLNFFFEDVEWCHRVWAKQGRVRVHSHLRLFHEPHQSLGGRWSPERAYLMAKNGTVYLATMLRVPLLSTLRWLVWESRLAARDLAAAQFATAIARMTGLAHGSVEAIGRTVTRTIRGNP